MDDVFQIIIWAFIIITFLASFFKKKNKQPSQPSPSQPYGQRRQEYEQTQTPVKVESQEYDILREIETMFKTDTSAPKQMEQKEYGWTGDLPTASEHEYKTERIDLSQPKSEHAFTSSKHVFESSIKEMI